MSDMKRFLVSYRHDGAQWNIELPATSFEDAERRLSQLHFGRVDGEVVATLPGSMGPVAGLLATISNLIMGKNR